MTTDGLLSLKMGMTYANVEKAIGAPICVSVDNPQGLSDADQRLAHESFDHCADNPIARPVPASLLKASHLVLSYAEPRDMFIEPRIYAHFNQGLFSGLYIKYHDFGICCSTGAPDSPFYWIGSRDLLFKLIGR